jgi:dihydroorotate dehydrogenase
VRPAVKFTDDLIEWQTRSNHGSDYLIGGNAGYTEVGSTTVTMLAGVFAAHCVIDLLAPKGAVNHYGLASNGLFYLLQQVGQALQVADFFLCRAVVKLSMVGDGQFRKGEMG